ncbi:uncharacterized protein G2W53_018644 [Senna tora]|uniref:Uncharacterized protein n=1 Tax=Senna tora TaxID=362788 RepID=A0A834WL98_9FABA|nr:uncharacterized protein G2W53_018644 [Senna tora]
MVQSVLLSKECAGIVINVALLTVGAIWGPEEAKVAVMLVMDVLGIISHQVYSVLGGVEWCTVSRGHCNAALMVLWRHYDGTMTAPMVL